MLKQGMSLDEIAQERRLARSTVIGHMERIAGNGIAVEVSHLLPETSKMREIEQAFRECGSGLLGPVKERLGERFEYEELKLARIQLRREGKLPDV